jgi:hypothetical protein
MNHLRLEDARGQLGLSTIELWVDYFDLGGTSTPPNSTATCAVTATSATPTTTSSSTPSMKCSRPADTTTRSPTAPSDDQRCAAPNASDGRLDDK